MACKDGRVIISVFFFDESPEKGGLSGLATLVYLSHYDRTKSRGGN